MNMEDVTKSAEGNRSPAKSDNRGKQANYNDNEEDVDNDVTLNLLTHETSTHSGATNYEANMHAWENLKEGDRKFIETSIESDDFTQLHRAAAGNKCEVLSYLLDSGANPNVRAGCDELTPLHTAIRSKCPEAIQILLYFGADPSMTSTNGTTPLHYACCYRDLDACQLLLDSLSLDVNIRDDFGMTAFHLACLSGNVELCDLLMKHGANIFTGTNIGQNSLHIASTNGNADLVEKLIQKAQISGDTSNLEVFIDSVDFENNTPLHMACKKGHVETAKVLLLHNADLDSRNDIVFNTPLHVAAQAGHVDIVKVLIDNGADVKAINELQRMPIHLAALFGHWEVIHCLLNNGSPIDPQDVTSLTPLLSAVSTGMLVVAERLIRLGADTDLRNDSLQNCIHIAVQNKKMDMLFLLVDRIGTEILDVGDNKLMLPIHYCARSGEFQMLQLILSKSSNAHPKDISYKTPLHLAAKNGNVDCLKALAEIDPFHVNDADINNITPLHEAAKKGNQKVYVCEFLLHVGADVTSKDRNRWTALHHAARSGYTGIVQVLLQAKTINPSQTIDEQDIADNTPLIIAAKNGHVDVVRLLISRGADITIRNKHRMTCLDEAVQQNKMMVVMEILNDIRWYEVVCHRPHDRIYPMKNLIEKMPRAAKAVFDRCIKFSNLPDNDRAFCIECDFRLLDSGISDDRYEIETPEDLNCDFESSYQEYEMESVKQKRAENESEGREGHSKFEVSFRSTSSRHSPNVVRRQRLRSRGERSQTGSRKGSKRTKRSNDEKAEKTTSSSHFYAPATMVEHKREALLSHPLIEIFLLNSWKNFGGHFFTITFLLYIIYVAVFTEFAITERTDDKEEKSILKCGDACFQIYFTFIASIIYLAKEILQMATMGFEYFKHISNYAEFLAYSFTLVSSLPYLEKIEPQFPLVTDALALFFLYSNIILFIRYVGVFGIYVMMFLEIMKTMIKVMFIFFLFIISFGLTLFILLKPQEAFDTIGWSFLKVVFMTIDELGFDDIVFSQKGIPFPVLTAVILVVFGLLLNVLLMNLLIGLAVGDIDTIQRNASFSKKAMTVEYILQTEERYFFRWLARKAAILKPSTVVFKPNEIENWLYAQYYSNQGVDLFRPTSANGKDIDMFTMVDQNKVLREIIAESNKLD